MELVGWLDGLSDSQLVSQSVSQLVISSPQSILIISYQLLSNTT